MTSYSNHQTSTPYYNILLDPPHELAEKQYAYNYLTERHLQVIWLEQKYFKGLKTSQGFAIEIISPGTWNGEAGPDFLKAHLRIGDTEVKGDIEMHLTDRRWTEHRHHLDARYNDVILHISLCNPGDALPINKENGELIHVVYLEEFLTISHTRILQLIDLELYPYRKFIKNETCTHTVFRPQSQEKIDRFFHSAAEWRLTQKRKYLKERIEDPGLLLGAGIAITLGCKNNSEAFFELFIRLVKYRQYGEGELLALGMGICGFFSEKYQSRWKDSEQYCQLCDHFFFLYSSAPHVISLVYNQARPLNHPIRRLVYLSKLIRDPSLLNLYSQMKSLWDWLWLQKQWNQLRQQLKELLPAYADPYWNFHYTFETKSSEEFLPLIGENLKMEIIANVLLPLVHEDVLASGDEKEIEAFYDFYTSIPTAKNRKYSSFF